MPQSRIEATGLKGRSLCQEWANDYPPLRFFERARGSIASWDGRMAETNGSWTGMHVAKLHDMPNPFRIAIVGTGKITATAHLPAALAMPGVEVRALVDPVIDRAKSLARQFGFRPRVASRVSDVLGEIDGAVIATPNHTHAEIALECLRAGASTLIEKPLAVSVLEGEAIVKAAADSGTVAAVGYVTRFQENVQLMADLVASDYFGRIRRFAYQAGSAGRWAPLSGYTLDRNATGGGVLMVTGTHFLDRMLYWFGYPDSVEYEDDSCGGPEANVVASFRYSGGRVFEGRLRLSKTVPLRGGFVMDTEAGIVVLREDAQAPVLVRPNAFPNLETVVRGGGGPRFEPGKRHFQLQLEDFVEACQTGRAPMAPAEHGLESLRLIEALYACRRPMATDWYPYVRREAHTL